EEQEAQERLVARRPGSHRRALEPALERTLAARGQGEHPAGTESVALRSLVVVAYLRHEPRLRERPERLIDVPGVEPPERPHALFEALLQAVAVIRLLAQHPEERILDHHASSAP